MGTPGTEIHDGITVATSPDPAATPAPIGIKDCTCFLSKLNDLVERCFAKERKERPDPSPAILQRVFLSPPVHNFELVIVGLRRDPSVTNRFDDLLMAMYLPVGSEGQLEQPEKRQGKKDELAIRANARKAEVKQLIEDLVAADQGKAPADQDFRNAADGTWEMPGQSVKCDRHGEFRVLLCPITADPGYQRAGTKKAEGDERDLPLWGGQLEPGLYRDLYGLQLHHFNSFKAYPAFQMLKDIKCKRRYSMLGLYEWVEGEVAQDLRKEFVAGAAPRAWIEKRTEPKFADAFKARVKELKDPDDPPGDALVRALALAPPPSSKGYAVAHQTYCDGYAKLQPYPRDQAAWRLAWERSLSRAGTGSGFALDGWGPTLQALAQAEKPDLRVSRSYDDPADLAAEDRLFAQLPDQITAARREGRQARRLELYTERLQKFIKGELEVKSGQSSVMRGTPLRVENAAAQAVGGFDATKPLDVAPSGSGDAARPRLRLGGRELTQDHVLVTRAGGGAMNIHRSYHLDLGKNAFVADFSEGCQVHRDPRKLVQLLKLAQIAKRAYCARRDATCSGALDVEYVRAYFLSDASDPKAAPAPAKPDPAKEKRWIWKGTSGTYASELLRDAPPDYDPGKPPPASYSDERSATIIRRLLGNAPPPDPSAPVLTKARAIWSTFVEAALGEILDSLLVAPGRPFADLRSKLVPDLRDRVLKKAGASAADDAPEGQALTTFEDSTENNWWALSGGRDHAAVRANLKQSCANAKRKRPLADDLADFLKTLLGAAPAPDLAKRATDAVVDRAALGCIGKVKDATNPDAVFTDKQLQGPIDGAVKAFRAALQDAAREWLADKVYAELVTISTELRTERDKWVVEQLDENVRNKHLPDFQLHAMEKCQLTEAPGTSHKDVRPPCGHPFDYLLAEVPKDDLKALFAKIAECMIPPSTGPALWKLLYPHEP